MSEPRSFVWRHTRLFAFVAVEIWSKIQLKTGKNMGTIVYVDFGQAMDCLYFKFCEGLKRSARLSKNR